MPYLISSADFSRKLGLYSKNIEHTERFILQGIKDFSLEGFILFPGYRLVKSNQGEQYRILAEESGQWSTVYAVELVVHDEITHPSEAITQVMVWRSPSLLHRHVVSGFPQIFFKHLLDRTTIVVSDSEQTGDGQRFWLTMLDWAFHQQYCLYVTDGTQDIDWVHYPIKTLDELETKWLDYAWGGVKDIHTHRRLIISKHELKEYQQ